MKKIVDRIFKNFKSTSENLDSINRDWMQYPLENSFRKNYLGLNPKVVLNEAIDISRICENIDHLFEFKIEEEGILVWKFSSVEKFNSFKQIIEMK